MIKILELKNQADFMPDYPNDILVLYPVSSFEPPPLKSPYRIAPTCLWYHFKKEEIPHITDSHEKLSKRKIIDYSWKGFFEDIQ